MAKATRVTWYSISWCPEKVQAEIDRVVGQSRPLTMDDRVNLPYTDAVLHEIQRIGNIVPLSLPHVTNKTIQLEGYDIPKVIGLIWNAQVKHTHSSLRL